MKPILYNTHLSEDTDSVGVLQQRALWSYWETFHCRGGIRKSEKEFHHTYLERIDYIIGIHGRWNILDMPDACV